MLDLRRKKNDMRVFEAVIEPLSFPKQKEIILLTSFIVLDHQ